MGAAGAPEFQARLARANADRLALREALSVRDALLHEALQRAARWHRTPHPPKDHSGPPEAAPAGRRISLLIPGSPGEAEVRRTIESVRRQKHPDVEVVVAGQVPPSRHRAPRPNGWGTLVTLVAVPPVSTAGDVTAALLEAARTSAVGAMVGVLAPGDELEPGALRALLAMLDWIPEPDVLYTDEQWPATGATGIATKPDYLPHYLQGYPYLGRLCLVRADLLERAGGFRPGFDGAEEWDAHLRVTELTNRVAHLPVIAVTRASAPRVDDAARASGLQAAKDRVARSGRAGDVEATNVPLGVRLWWAVPEPPLVSIIVPTAGGRRRVRGEDSVLVERCLRSLLDHTTYDRWELVLVTSERTPPDVIDRVRELAGDRLVHAPVAGPFSFSASVNEGARVARGTHLLLLNDDTEIIEPRWLDRMVSVAAEPGVGVVGAKLLFEEGTIQHVGIIVDDKRTPIHPLGSEVDGPGRFGTKELDVDYLAVTGACLLTPAAVFQEVGGFCQTLPLNFNDIDYCLKVVARGLAVVSTPFARLTHFESSTRGHALEPWEQGFLDRHWGLRLGGDPHVQYRSLL